VIAPEMLIRKLFLYNHHEMKNLFKGAFDKLDKKNKNYKGRGGIRVKKKNFKTLKLFYSSVFISFKTK
jgi:hypothetical protein